MIPRIALDSTPLSLLSHPDRGSPVAREVNLWLEERLLAGVAVLIPEIADYEVRRELIRARKARSVRALDELIARLVYLPLDTAMMRRAAEIWAQVRNQGLPTAAPGALDADVILAAQAERVGAVVATQNVAHLSRFVTARHWREIR